jgi:Primase C terminal 1 (PriCT-1)
MTAPDWLRTDPHLRDAPSGLFEDFAAERPAAEMPADLRDAKPEPWPARTRLFLETLFAGYATGLVEIASTPASGTALNTARLFDDLDEAVEYATGINRNPGVNVYVGAALRRTSCARDRRCIDDDFLTAPAVWCDIDDGAAAKSYLAKCAGLHPTMCVTTGTVPDLRRQLWWKLAEPCDDPNAVRKACAGIARALGGDVSVVNPGRVMRLPGCIAWPKKPARVWEQVGVTQPRPGLHHVEALQRQFPAPIAEVVEMPTRQGGGRSGPFTLPETVPEGGRNHAIARLAGHLLRLRVDPVVSFRLVDAFNRTSCRPPMPAAEVARTFNSILAKEAERRGLNHDG